MTTKPESAKVIDSMKIKCPHGTIYPNEEIMRLNCSAFGEGLSISEEAMESNMDSFKAGDAIRGERVVPCDLVEQDSSNQASPAAALKAENERMRKALSEIIAKLDGTFGKLTPTTNTLAASLQRIANAALDSKDGK